jgi:hypothetical protein
VPFLRVIRDKRGYETTYLMHWFREGNRQHSRILYVFRSPGGVRVGRPALEPEVLRRLEATHPQIEFDWSSVLDNRQVVEPAIDTRRPRRRRREDEPSAAPTAPPVLAPAPIEPPKPEPRPRFVVPAKIEGDTADAQVAFLQHWYALVREQVVQRATDPARREALLVVTERLNPVGWTDADAITAGLQDAAEALERLSQLFAKRRRRTRRSGRPQGAPAAGAANGGEATAAAHEDSPEPVGSSDHPGGDAGDPTDE